MAAQRLFGDFPAATSAIPGMVTPNTTADMMTRMSPQEQARMWQLEDRRKAEREARNAEIIAQRQAEQQGRQDTENRGRVWEAFQKMYAPQLQGLYHDTMVQREGVTGPMGIPRKVAGSFSGSPFASNVPFGETGVPGQRGSVAPYRMDQAKLNTMLTNMWQQQTDPYMRVAAQMSGSMPTAPAGGIEAVGSGPGGGSQRRRSGGGRTTPAAGFGEPLPTVEEWKKKYPR
jgi:hypothetical protein